MIEIRVICPTGDADQIEAALAAAFRVGGFRRYPARDGQRMRLYVTADTHPTCELARQEP
ncbi:hypothetical protein [Streptomyces sp. Caat 7-52]|uniref:hypothetical protein n=1 Tax=Streptomyces sp. Caat 7-52 TaxID=2949637 RepID=UPI0020358FA0|nr:hypothetical protein [Streptomyces sp. Caat 7-52]